MKKNTSTTRAERVRQAIRHRQEQEKQVLRQAILKAAGELFLEQGYDRFSLRKVAERIGYSATTIYLYFQDKDDLLFHVVDEGFERFGDQLTAAAGSTEDPQERLLAIHRAYLDFGLRNPVYYQLMFMQRADLLLRRRANSLKPRIATFDILLRAVQQALEAGVLRAGDARAYSDSLWAALHGIVALAISMPFLFDEARIEETIAVTLKMLYEGLGPD